MYDVLFGERPPLQHIIIAQSYEQPQTRTNPLSVGLKRVRTQQAGHDSRAAPRLAQICERWRLKKLMNLLKHDG
jgi:hypothetical protein